MDELAEVTPDALIVVDNEGTVLDVNAAGEELFKRPKNTLVGAHFKNLLKVRDGAQIDISSWTGTSTVVELRATEIEWKGQSAFLVYLRDTTERRAVAQSCNRLQELHQSIIDTLTSHIAILDENANIIAVNAAWRYFAADNGLKWPDYGVGHNYLEVAEQASGPSAEGAEQVAAAIRDLLNKEETSLEFEYPCHSPRKERWFHVRGRRFCVDDGERILLAHQPITQRKRAELDLRQALDDLQKVRRQILDQERQRAMTEMASGIAHDFNNVLSPIQGFSKMLLDNPEKLNDRQKTLEYLEHINKAAGNATEIISRMRKFYKPRAEEQFSEVDLNEVVTEAVSLTQPRWKEQTALSGRSIEIETALGEVPKVRGNEADLSDVVTNLIFNAVDVMPEGGTIRISTSVRENTILLTVSDTGLGMSEETRQKCMEPFYTTKGDQGTGLGLASIEGIVQRHNGDLTIDSRENEGTTFRITLPMFEGAATKSAHEEEIAPPPPLNILAVDDQESQRELLRELLAADGHSVSLAENGSEAMERLEAGRHDVIITDSAMPEISGLQLSARVKQAVPDIPVIMASGFAGVLETSQEYPNVDVLVSKPTTQRKLREALNKVIQT